MLTKPICCTDITLMVKHLLDYGIPDSNIYNLLFAIYNNAQQHPESYKAFTDAMSPLVPYVEMLQPSSTRKRKVANKNSKRKKSKRIT